MRMKFVQWMLVLGTTMMLNACDGGLIGNDKTPEAYRNPAVAPYTEKIEKNPVDPEAYYERAMALANVKADSLAMVDFEHALGLDPANPKIIYRYANFLFEINEFEKAAVEYEKMINLNPKNEDAILGIIQTYLKLKDVTNAKKYLEPPLQSLPGHPVLTYFTAEIACIEKDTTKAIGILDKLILQDDLNYEAQFLKAEILAAQGKIANVKYFEKAFSIDTLDALPLEKIGDYYFEQKDYTNALKYYKKSVTADLNYEYGFYKAGNAYMAMDSLDKALNSYNLALQSDFRYLDAYLGKAAVFEKMNLKDSAIHTYQMALQFHPKSEKAKAGLGK